MSQLSLARLLRPNKPHHAVIENIVQTLVPELTVLDAQGHLLLGQSKLTAERTEILLNEQLQGWVCGPKDQRLVLADLLTQLLVTEDEKRKLSAQVLDNYRELNLLYNLSERLIAAPEPPAIANMALKEASRLLTISSAWVLLMDGQGNLISVARKGQQLTLKLSSWQDHDLIHSVMTNGEAEIRNNEPLDSIFNTEQSIKGDLICAPLKTDQRVLGVLLLAGISPLRFAAHQLKLVNAVALQVGPALEIARLYQVAVEKGRMEQELRQAYEVQANLIPRQTPQIEGWEFAGRWQPARELSGDYYDFIPLADGHLGLVTGDVADKGMPSSLFMVFTRSAVRSAVSHIHSPAEAINQTNDLVAQESQNGLFVTLMYGCLEPESGRLEYVNAGHNPPILIESASGKLRELRSTGIPLGISPQFNYMEKVVYLNPDDYLIFYTDGVTDAINKDFEEFGLQRLQGVIKANRGKTAEEMASEINAAVLKFTGDRPLFDDLTLMVVKRNS